MLLLRVSMESLGHRTIQHRFCCQLMLPIRRIVANLLTDHSVCLVLKELSLVRRLNRATGKLRYLFPVIPHYWIERRSIILPTQVLVGSSWQSGLRLFRVLSNGEETLTSLFILTKLYRKVNKYKYSINFIYLSLPSLLTSLLRKVWLITLFPKILL